MTSGGIEERQGRDLPRLRIFLSSTNEDLGAYRREAVKAIASLEQRAVRMETFAAEPRAPLATCRRTRKRLRSQPRYGA